MRIKIWKVEHLQSRFCLVLSLPLCLAHGTPWFSDRHPAPFLIPVRSHREKKVVLHHPGESCRHGNVLSPVRGQPAVSAPERDLGFLEILK